MIVRVINTLTELIEQNILYIIIAFETIVIIGQIGIFIIILLGL